MKSIRNNLLISIFSVVLFSTLLIAIFTFISAQEEIHEIYDENIKQVAVVLSSHDGDLILNNKATGKLKGEDELLIQYWKDDVLSYSSHPLIKLELQEQQGFGNVLYEGDEWRYFQRVNGNKTYQVSQSLDNRNEAIIEITLGFILPILLQLPFLIVLAYIFIGRGLKPLIDISERVKTRSASHLDSIDSDDVPAEVLPLINALNQLLRRLENSLKLQREFTADAAHELRTPLTAISLQLEILQRAETDAERKEAEERLREGIDRSAHLVQNLLLLARQEPESIVSKFENVNLSSVSKDIVERLKIHAEKKHQSLEYKSSEQDVMVHGCLTSLETLIQNLVENAIAYTPENGCIEVHLSHKNNQAVLSVLDDGIGISNDDKKRVFDRFYRVLGTNKSGSGLGLSIVQSIVDAHQGSIIISEGLSGKGCQFTVTLPS